MFAQYQGWVLAHLQLSLTFHIRTIVVWSLCVSLCRLMFEEYQDWVSEGGAHTLPCMPSCLQMRQPSAGVMRRL